MSATARLSEVDNDRLPNRLTLPQKTYFFSAVCVYLTQKPNHFNFIAKEALKDKRTIAEEDRFVDRLSQSGRIQTSDL